MTNTQAASAGFTGNTLESIIATETISPQINYSPAMVEVMTVIETLIRRGWVKIDDSQSGSWTPINVWKKN